MPHLIKSPSDTAQELEAVGSLKLDLNRALERKHVHVDFGIGPRYENRANNGSGRANDKSHKGFDRLRLHNRQDYESRHLEP
jgi:hypothetical protein